MRFGVDYSYGDPGIKALKDAGVTFVCRYISTPGNPKNLRADEAARLKKAGIDIVVVFETTTGRALSGYTAGINDAYEADRQALAVGAPQDSVIYFAVDFDANARERKIVNQYLGGAAAALGKRRVGVYGGYYVVKEALDVGVVTYAWQTYAWSANQWDPRVHIEQYSNGHRLDGAAVDYDRAMTANFGQWSALTIDWTDPKNPRVVRPLPGPGKKPAWFWVALKEFLARRRKGGVV